MVQLLLDIESSMCASRDDAGETTFMVFLLSSSYRISCSSIDGGITCTVCRFLLSFSIIRNISFIVFLFFSGLCSFAHSFWIPISFVLSFPLLILFFNNFSDMVVIHHLLFLFHIFCDFLCCCSFLLPQFCKKKIHLIRVAWATWYVSVLWDKSSQDWIFSFAKTRRTFLFFVFLWLPQ